MDDEPFRHCDLESILKDPSAQPYDLRLQYLRDITDDFSTERELGRGGFGVVYKGMLPNGKMIAVKNLVSSSEVQQKQYKNEVDNLMRVRHQNIVQFVGYCYETWLKYTDYNGKHIFAERPKRLLCFEYMPKGSLDRYISDESSGLDWPSRYKIIKGICCGLHYLHEECQTNASVIHLDLKPANILLDDNMEPKIADFGLSKFFDDQKVQTCATTIAGSRGYMAPEYILNHIITTKADIYSLGVIIIEMITGCRIGPFGITVTSCQDFVEPVLGKWRNRFEETPGHASPELECQQIESCLQIGLSCIKIDRMERPTTKEIIEKLHRWESTNCYASNEENSHKDKGAHGNEDEDMDSAEEPTAAAPEESPKAAPALAIVAPAGDLPLPSPRRGGGEVGIRGARPPLLSPPLPIGALAPPPARRSFVDDYMTRSAWDIVQSFAPREQGSELGERVDTRCNSDTEEENAVEDGVAAVEGELKELRIGETFEGFTGTSSLSTTNDDDASSTTTEAMFIISPNGKFKRKIKSWMRGALLGSGSFGMVYEGISDEGAFFAVKEVSLLDQGSNAQQSIVALEQEIALLSQFEHENIVQYYGTDKEESKLYIFIELVTQGSLSSLYQKYKLRESQVSAYTRQILNGLVYLHERNVVHRDIKCANILVHANGSVKLADFGLAKEMSKINMLRSCKGSVYWMAPEVINPKKMYGPSADIWSLGCTVLEMLTRQIPFPNVEWTNAFFMIGRGEQPTIPNYLSKEAQDFIGQCVRVDPESRPSASQLLEHPFVNRPLRASFESSSPPAIRL